jgi:6-phosphogluconate dehydrogenase (decarboxylating)
MVTVGLVGAGAMGSALGANWIAGGADVVVCAADRSPRTQRLVAAAGLRSVPDLEDVVRADLVVSVVPPAEAVPAASMIMRAAKRAGVTPLVADLNAIAPSTLQSVQEVLGHAGLDLVDGSVSGPPPRANGIATRIYVSGPRSAELTGIASPWAEVIALPGNTCRTCGRTTSRSGIWTWQWQPPSPRDSWPRCTRSLSPRAPKGFLPRSSKAWPQCTRDPLAPSSAVSLPRRCLRRPRWRR